MKRLSNVLRAAENGHMAFWCTGCDMPHQIFVGEGRQPCWTWNGSSDRPTFSPSVRVCWSEPSDNAAEAGDESKDIKKQCHTFVTDGQIQYLDDCTHAMKGTTVPLAAFPEWWGDDACQ